MRKGPAAGSLVPAFAHCAKGWHLSRRFPASGRYLCGVPPLERAPLPCRLEMADEAVVAHPVTPQTLPFTAQRLAPVARILC
jgi:hypothetical protein